MRLVNMLLIVNILFAVGVFAFRDRLADRQSTTGLIEELILVDQSLDSRMKLRELPAKIRTLEGNHLLPTEFFRELDHPNLTPRTAHQLLQREITRLLNAELQCRLITRDRIRKSVFACVVLCGLNFLGFASAILKVRKIRHQYEYLEDALQTSKSELVTSRDRIKRKVRDFLQLRRKHDSLHEQFITTLRESELDPKGTGAFAAKAGMKLLHQVIEQTLGRAAVWVLMIDADKFKNVNDTYGHRAGDIVLETLVACFKSQIRESDFVFRNGGEEFVAVLSGGTASEARGIAERLRLTVAETPIWIGDRDITVTVSIGMAECANADEYLSTLSKLRNRDFNQLGEADTCRETIEKLALETMEVADGLLYKAKHGGRNRVVSSVASSGPLVAAGA